MTVAVIDVDYIKYSVASAGETRTIKAYHPITGDEWECKTRTELWGHYLKKDKGILVEFNKTNGTAYTADELVVVDIQTPEPIQNVYHSAKSMFETALRHLNTNKYVAYVGKGDSFRVERSTILKYKGQRSNSLKPLLLDDVSEYLIKKYKAEVVTHLEVDDRVVIEAYDKDDHAIVGIDKDYAGCHVKWFNPNKYEDGVVDCRKFGELFLNQKGGVKGFGRLFFYHQILSGDSSDNYKANSANPEFEWGDKSSYKLLKDCKTDKEALEAIKKGYQLIYPEPRTIVGWRGDEIEVDWKYCAKENFDLARMLRWENDNVDFYEVLNKFGLLED